MPAVFAHDLFGRKVYCCLSPQIKKIIKENRDCFYLGLHGPDILFFYRALVKNPVAQKGYSMHSQSAADIINRGLRILSSEEAGEYGSSIEAYLLGFACHYALDHSLHPFINEITEHTSFTHAELETELDRRLLQREGKDPLRTFTSCHIKCTRKTKRAAAMILGESDKTTAEAIISFRWVSRIFINSCKPFKKFIDLFLRAAGRYEEIHGMMMQKEPVPGSGPITNEMEKRFCQAVRYGAFLTQALYTTIHRGQELPAEFYGNFEGKDLKA